MKILVTDTIAQAGIDILKQDNEVDVQTGLTPEQIKSCIGQYEALVVRSQTKVTQDIIDSADKMQVIGRAGVGVDNIDVEAATRRGILVVNSPEGNIVSTAEHTIAMLLALVRNIPKSNSQLGAGVWNRSLKGREIRNKLLGIIGLGRVGTEVAEMARGLRLNVIAYDPMVSQDRAERLGVQMVEMEALLKTADFITIHVPLNPSTRGLIGREQLKLVKPTAMMINCARGGLIDEEALYEALENGSLAGAAIDTFSKEPAGDNILLKSDKVIATPHLAASTIEAENSAGIDIAEQIVAILKGYPPKSPVNAPIISSEAISVLGPYLQLGKTMGLVAAQMIEGHFKSLTLRYQGDIAEETTAPLKVAVLSGLLEAVTDERVTIVNADIITKKRGLQIREEKDSTRENYTSLLTLELETTAGKTLIAGSSLRGTMHLVRVNNYWFEIEFPDAYMLFTEHKDRPGVVGAVGAIIGDAGINIIQMQVSRGVKVGDNAMMVLCLNTAPSEECHQQILAIPDMYKAIVVKLAG